MWYRVKKTYEKPHGGFLAIGPRYPGVLSNNGLVVVFTELIFRLAPIRWQGVREAVPRRLATRA